MTGMPVRRAAEPLLAALAALAALGIALVSQHHFDLQPCPWCVLQRLIFVLGAGVALLEAAAVIAAQRRVSGAQRRVPLGCQWAAGLRLLLAVAGVAAAAWQHLVAAAQASCKLTHADQILAWTQLDRLVPDLFQPRASCLDAKAWLLGVPYEFWSGTLFILLGAAALVSLRVTASLKA